ncbi:hypothetical protein [Serratia symbiotica]|uniref:Uncharacterized protein n=1 Tax=Serratia symbiotica TaxID=138074 RepID=A0A068Z7D9_9GAMM|nr:hypothetical protein [Serratia symbiotica]QLH63214.1 hypothetical protein SYMBAF_10090 [Serratia symbiotica]QLH64528.1 hypothetical protein SYMBAF_17020 [Serratia symbiotica]CDS57034.1 conserved hypothetical protein [Serratia symbiotica]CDS57777.1 conserved hypothetical protein [Serratia symbiotica]
MKKHNQPHLSEKEIKALAQSTIENFVNSCHCKNKDDIFIALSFLIDAGLNAGETVKYGKMAVVQ